MIDFKGRDRSVFRYPFCSAHRARPAKSMAMWSTVNFPTITP